MMETEPFDLDEIKPCAFCGQGIAHTGSPIFYEFEIRQCVLDPNNIRQIHGLETMMGNAAIARVFAPTSTVAHRLGGKRRQLVCMDCAMTSAPPISTMIETEKETT